MIYLEADDLTADAYQQYINESTSDMPSVIDMQELRAIGIAKTYMRGRYDVAAIFDETNPIRDELLVDILTKIVLYKIFSRNAVRKLPTDIKEDNDWAMKKLGELNSGKLVLDGLPTPTDEDGDSSISPMFGNTSNSDFYI